MVRLRFFASLREALGTAEELVELPAHVATVRELTGWLQSRDARWQGALSDPRLLTARNHTVTDSNAVVQDGDEIAWYPPVTGG